MQDVCDCIAEVTEEPPTIVTSFETNPEYETAIRRVAPIDAVVGIQDLDETLDGHEPSDWLLVVDPHTMPADGTKFQKLLTSLTKTHETRHLVALDKGNQGTREYVQLDAQGQVKRIQRFYDGVTWLQTSAVAASLLPVSAAREVPSSMFGNPAALREALVTTGAVSRDIGIKGSVFNLNRERGLLQFCEHRMRNGMLRPPPSGYEARVSGVWIASRCSVHPSARLYGPVVLHEGVCVDANATLVGPVVVGAESRVRHDALLMECLVSPGTDVPARTNSQHRVICGNGDSHAAQVANLEMIEDRLERPIRFVSMQQHSQHNNDKKQRDKYVSIKRVGEGLVAFLGLVIVSPLMMLTAPGGQIDLARTGILCP